MKEECLLCGAPLEYLETDVQMQCEICRKKELAKTRCVNGHYVCSDCHMQGLDSIVELCLRETACDPIAIVERMMALPSCHMHGPEHHVMVGAALLTAYHNAGGDIALSDALMEMLRRGKSVPGGACGFWGACGAGISTGMFVSIISRSTPLTDEPFALSHKMTAAALGQIGEIGGRTLLFLVLSGLATGASWLCYYRALQDGLASVVVPIDKLSILVTILFSYLVFHEKLGKKEAGGLVLIVAGTLGMLV